MKEALKSALAGLEAIFLGLAIASIAGLFMSHGGLKTLLWVAFILACPLFLIVNRLKIGIRSHAVALAVLLVLFVVVWVPLY